LCVWLIYHCIFMHVELLSLINVISKSLVKPIVLIFYIVVFHSFLSSYWTKRLSLTRSSFFTTGYKNPHAKITRQHKSDALRSRIKSWDRRLIQDVLRRIPVTNWKWQTYGKRLTRNCLIYSLRIYFYGNQCDECEMIKQ